MSSANFGLITKLLFGSIATLLLGSAFGYYFDWFNFFKTKTITNGHVAKSTSASKVPFVKSVASAETIEDASDSEEDDDDAEEEEPEEDDEDENEEFAVESVSDEEEETEEKRIENEKEEAFLLVKSKYDDASRIAQKLIQGQQFERAAEKLTECISYASDIKIGNRDLLALYNNRSAMYEKCGQFELGLKDIKILLAMDPNHSKARGRRGRIYEAQGKLSLALKDFVYGMVMERMKGEAPANEKKIEDLSKLVAVEASVSVLAAIRGNQDRPIPHKTYNFLFCRNFMETFPNTHKWKAKYRDMTREALETQLEYACDDKIETVRATLELVCFDLAKEAYVSAFATFASLEQHYLQSLLETTGSVANDEGLPSDLLSLCWELKGTEQHLKCFLSGALDAYTQAIRWNANNVEAKLKLAGVHMELGENEKAAELYEQLMSVLQIPAAVNPDITVLKSMLSGLDTTQRVVSSASTESSPRPPSPPSSSHSRSNSETERGDGTPDRTQSPEPVAPVPVVTKTATTTTVAGVVCEDVDSEDEEEETVKVSSTTEVEATETEIPASDSPVVVESGRTSITMDQSAFLDVSTATAPDTVTATVTAGNESPFDAQETVCYRAWTLIHRANIWISRDDRLQYMNGAVQKALKDVDAALELTKLNGISELPEGKAARFIALLKSVHILTQTKQQAGETPSPEDTTRNLRSIAEAKKLFPKHESRLLLEADLLSAEGQSAEALALVEEAHRTTLKGDVTPLVMKASILCTQVLIELQTAAPPSSREEYDAMQEKTKESFKGVEEYYEQALVLEPNGIEVLAQYAQYKNMVSGDFQGAVSMLQRAVPLSRSRDEAIELCQLLVMNEAQWEAIQEMQGQQQ